MISIKSSAGMSGTIAILAEGQLKDILKLRMAQLSVWEGYDLGQISQFLIMIAGDSDADAANDVRFSLLENMVDGIRFPDEGFEPSFEFIDYHADVQGLGWWELIYIFGSDFGITVLLQDHKDSDPELLAMCRKYSEIRHKV
jgi:hypothetical protein